MNRPKTCLLIDDDRFIHIVLEDNGIGFSQEHVNQIFVIFQRLNDRQKYSGRGIGLAMCKKMSKITMVLFAQAESREKAQSLIYICPIIDT
jgi:light-regulated signal transduction histidine kinase (bacteriophytochrome)